MNYSTRMVALGDITTELSDGLHKAPVFYPGAEYIFVNATNLENGRIVDKEPAKHTNHEEYKKYGVPLSDRTILYSIDGTIGNIARYRGEKVVLGKGACYINVDQSCDVDYIYYQLQSPHFTDYIRSMATGSTIRHISLRTMRNYVFSLPPLSLQKRVASILSSIDRRIENNFQINDNLLQQAMAIFNDRYDSAEEQCPFTSLIHVLGGGTPKTGNPEFWNGNIPFFTPKDVGSPYTFQTEKTITPTGLEHCNSRLYPKNTSFVTARGTVGKVSLAGKPMAMNQSCYALASDSIDPILVYFYTLRAVDSLKHKASGAVFDAIVTRDFETEVISVIPEPESKVILALIAPMLEAIHTNAEENIRLATLRDALLPRLMSGEIDVSSVTL